METGQQKIEGCYGKSTNSKEKGTTGRDVNGSFSRSWLVCLRATLVVAKGLVCVCVSVSVCVCLCFFLHTFLQLLKVCASLQRTGVVGSIERNH